METSKLMVTWGEGRAVSILVGFQSSSHQCTKGFDCGSHRGTTTPPYFTRLAPNLALFFANK
ncbi:conserved hypothetical protein [Ricinus communis]|uniref:Uncharacterized protein n=1 Tax=Ricinus communis TaxID=3988 RepID=B9RJ89_RICCO|nr:conserved hypothetical protein [Ricinus communis]